MQIWGPPRECAPVPELGYLGADRWCLRGWGGGLRAAGAPSARFPFRLGRAAGALRRDGPGGRITAETPGHLIVWRSVSSFGWTRAGRGRPGGTLGCLQRPPLPLSRSSGFPGCVRIPNKKGKARPKLIFQRREETLFPASYNAGAKQTDTGAIVPPTMWPAGAGGARGAGRGAPGAFDPPSGARAQRGDGRGPCLLRAPRTATATARPGPSEGRTRRAQARNATGGEEGRRGATRRTPRSPSGLTSSPAPARRTRGMESHPCPPVARAAPPRGPATVAAAVLARGRGARGSRRRPATGDSERCAPRAAPGRGGAGAGVRPVRGGAAPRGRRQPPPR